MANPATNPAKRQKAKNVNMGFPLVKEHRRSSLISNPASGPAEAEATRPSPMRFCFMPLLTLPFSLQELKRTRPGPRLKSPLRGG
uniref:Alternative protein n=1 Tax=Heterorhabditis bacteriophora TaxID=37862 RepID=A0A1I7WBZ1_HETBA